MPTERLEKKRIELAIFGLEGKSAGPGDNDGWAALTIHAYSRENLNITYILDLVKTP